MTTEAPTTTSAPRAALDASSGGEPAGGEGARSIADLRVSYSKQPLDDDTLTSDPIPLFSTWMSEARAAQTAEPNAMTLATADAAGRPSARMVLLKGVDARGFVWYTNYGSRKGAQLDENAHAALVFWWPEVERSVRVEGVVARVSPAESDAYFNSRPAASRLGAWASDQSRPLENREVLQHKWDALVKDHLKTEPGGETVVTKEIPRPPFWGGFRLVPSKIEFWKGSHARLHDRILYERELPDVRPEELVETAVEGGWTRTRLQP